MVLKVQWSLSDLLNLPNGHLEFTEEMNFKPEDLVRFKRIRNITKASVAGSGHYEPSQNRLYLNLNIQGEMIVPWEVVKEEDYEKSRKEQPDSRLEKLKDYIPKD